MDVSIDSVRLTRPMPSVSNLSPSSTRCFIPRLNRDSEYTTTESPGWRSASIASNRGLEVAVPLTLWSINSASTPAASSART
ncbi:hypothetical protein AXK59_21615 [Tsukamurella tyrosinosolvens]|nr:hypothetical protein AXK59_21615 [Tsukamurella tyrosinosolvens]KZL94852.1 hypothetical protein AXX05_09455 [Tsukamurella tyrosinosolvens]